jgi:hypothetical protein
MAFGSHLIPCSLKLMSALVGLLWESAAFVSRVFCVWLLFFHSKLSEHAVIQTVQELQDDGCTVPFVAVTSDRSAKTKRR